MVSPKLFFVALAFLACSGCSVISGTVRDATSGDPLSDVRVGVLVLRPGAIEAEFEERTRTDSEGRYQIAYGATQPTVVFRLEDYLTVALHDTSDPSSLDVDLQSITAIKGVWNATIAVDGETIPATTFDFDEDGMHWRAGGDSLGVARYAFDGTSIDIDDALAHGDAIEGEITASLEVSESGDALTGDITFNGGFFADTGCESGCSGTVAATPID